MAILSKGYTFGAAEQVTSTKLANLVDAATFASGAVDGSSTTLTGGKIVVKDNGITTGKIADNAVTAAKAATQSDVWDFNSVSAKKAALETHTFTTSSSTLDIDLDDGQFQVITIDRNITTVNTLGNKSSGKQFTFIFQNGNYTVSGWDSTWKFFGATTPDITAVSAGSAIDIMSGVTDGTNAYVTLLKNFG